jgi:multisubunit Na+/H+ antiporter MnhG subunit
MDHVISNLLYKAIGVALSPVPIIVVILMLFSKRARSNSLAFLLGWVLSLAAMGSAVLLLANAGHVSGGGTPSRVAYMTKLLIGVGFLYMAHRSWQRRPTHGELQELPPWTARIDTVSPGRSFMFAALLAVTNTKNLGMTLGAALLIALGGLDSPQPWIALTVFVLLASTFIALPVLYYLLARASAEKTLTDWKDWLITNNTAASIVLFLILGAKFVGDGLGWLLGQ